MDIGGKIKKSRTDAKITQEQAAQALGISRQTISNWENEKSYPDIVSVLKMSDLRKALSIKTLLQGKISLSKLLVVLSYLVIWAFNIMASWRFSAGSITEAQAGGAQWIMLPAATIVLSLLIGKNNYWGKHKWLVPIGFGLMLMLSVYASYGMRESLIFNRVDLQTLSFFFIGTIASMIGMVLGHALFADQKSKEKSK